MAVLYIVLRDLTLVDLHLLRQKVGCKSLLKEGMRNMEVPDDADYYS